MGRETAERELAEDDSQDDEAEDDSQGEAGHDEPAGHAEPHDPEQDRCEPSSHAEPSTREPELPQHLDLSHIMSPERKPKAVLPPDEEDSPATKRLKVLLDEQEAADEIQYKFWRDQHRGQQRGENVGGSASSTVEFATLPRVYDTDLFDEELATLPRYEDEDYEIPSPDGATGKDENEDAAMPPPPPTGKDEGEDALPRPVVEQPCVEQSTLLFAEPADPEPATKEADGKELEIIEILEDSHGAKSPTTAAGATDVVKSMSADQMRLLMHRAMQKLEAKRVMLSF